MLFRSGVRRLALLRHGDFISGIRKRLPIKSMAVKLAMSTLGCEPKNNVQETLLAAMNSTLAPLPRTAEEFDAACLRMRERLYDTIAGPLEKLWEHLVAAEAPLREFCLTASRDRFAARIAEDLQQEWQWLTRPGFLSSLPPDALADIARFARGLRERLTRITQQPAARELERIDSLRAVLLPDFYTRYPRHLHHPAWLAYGMMVAEFRLSLFAPSLAVKGRSSAKKLAAAADLLA